MGKKGSSSIGTKKYEIYLNGRKRISNKERKQRKYLSARKKWANDNKYQEKQKQRALKLNNDVKSFDEDNYLKHNKLGRQKEKR